VPMAAAAAPVTRGPLSFRRSDGAAEAAAAVSAMSAATTAAALVPGPALGRGPRNRSTRFKGVSLYRRTGRFEAHIWHEGG
jgi:hypothetical protein